jgi:4-amino-4-deoxy-L-arabinose transferase-like glycosyltransferase
MKKSIKYFVLSIKKWIKNNRWEAFFLLVILLIAVFFRLYRISEYMTFLGDEGRDAIIVRRLLVDFDPILIGPGTSIGNMYLGPLYYYLIAPSLLLANFSPVGPSVFIALLGIVTVFFIWYVAREWFPVTFKGQSLKGVNIAALVASGLYAISPVVITYSRSSWNPNIMPFFALLCIYSIWKVWYPYAKVSGGRATQSKRYLWLIALGISFAFVMQSHYLGLLLAPVIAIFWFLTFLKIRKQTGKWKIENRKFLRNTFYGLIIFAGLMSPLLIFDARHGWINFSAIKTFFLERQTTVSARPWNAIPKIIPISRKIVTRMVAAMNEIYGKWVEGVLVVGIFWVISRLSGDGFKDKKNSAFLLLFVWLGISLVGLGLYKQEIYDHYYGFFSPAVYIFLGGFTQVFLEKRKFSLIHILLGVLLFVLVIINIQNNPLKYPPNRQMQRARSVAEKISEESGGNKFNLAVIAERNYEDGYQYFLEKEGEPVYDIDPLNLDATLANTLFVVCELPKDKCDPTHNPKAEVANFGWSKIEGEWEVSGVTVYKLSHTQNSL